MNQLGFPDGLPGTRLSRFGLRRCRGLLRAPLGLVVVLHALAGCSETSSVDLELTELQRAAALQGVPLDSIVLRVSGDGFETIERSLTPDNETVRIQVPTGPSRRFELIALRSIEDADLPELPVFFGETEQDLVVGANSVELRYLAQGALNVSLEVIGGDVAPAIASLTLRDEEGLEFEVDVGRTTALPVGAYRVAVDEQSFAPLRAPEALVFNVELGEVAAGGLFLFEDATQCDPDAPPVVREDGLGCRELEVDVTGLRVGTFFVELNGVLIELDVNGDPVSGGILEIPVGQDYEVVFESAGENPAQRCRVVPGTGEGSSDQDSDSLPPVEVECTTVFYPVNFEVFGTNIAGLTVQEIIDGSEVVDGTASFDSPGFQESTLEVEEGDDLDTTTFAVATQPTEGTSQCTLVNTQVTVGSEPRSPSEPLRIYCLEQARPVYPDSPNLGQYLRNDGPDRLSASGAPCTEDAEGFDACVYAGIMRSYVIPGFDSCDGLFVTDSAGVLEWRCLERDGEVIAVSEHVVSLSPVFDVVAPSGGDPGGAVLYDFSPRFSAPGFSVPAQGPPVVRWGNALAEGDGDFSFDSAGTVYVLGTAPSPAVERFIIEDEITVVVLTGQALEDTEISADDASFVTISGDFRRTGRGTLVSGFGESRWMNVSGRLSGAGNTSGGFGVILPEQSLVRNAEIQAIGTAVAPLGEYSQVQATRILSVNVGIEINGSHQRVRDVVMTNALVGVTNNVEGESDDVWIDGLDINQCLSGIDVSDSSYLHVSNSRFRSCTSDAISIDSMSTVVVRHSTSTNHAPAAFSAGDVDDVYIEGLLSEGAGGVDLAFASSVRIRDSAFFDASNIVSITDSDQVEAVGTFVFAETETLGAPACTVVSRSPGVSSVGFVNSTCVDGEDQLPAPSTAKADVLAPGTSVVTEPVTRAEIDPELPVLDVSPAPEFLESQVVVWQADVGSDTDCSMVVAGSVYNPIAFTCETVFLTHATELEGDGDGFCETGETCQYLPNVGNDQGAIDPLFAMPVNVDGVADVVLLVPSE
ncbi:MAG: right-handed parallel beta-helix repeat-containing protein [Myxococcota bacterium]